MKTKKSLLLIFIFFLIVSFSAEAIEVYTFISQDCQTETGLIIALDKTNSYENNGYVDEIFWFIYFY